MTKICNDCKTGYANFFRIQRCEICGGELVEEQDEDECDNEGENDKDSEKTDEEQ